MGELSQFFDKEHGGFTRGAMGLYFKNKSGIKFGFLSSGWKRHWKIWINETDNAAEYWCEKYDRDSYRKSFIDHGQYNIGSVKFTVEYACEPRETSSKNNNSDIVDNLRDSFLK